MFFSYSQAKSDLDSILRHIQDCSTRTFFKHFQSFPESIFIFKVPPRPWGKKMSFFHNYFLPCLNSAYKSTLPRENVLQGCFVLF